MSLETEFLPAHLELIQTPAPALARTLLWTILGMVSLGLLWAWFGQLDEVAVAQGKVVPHNFSRPIQATEAATIRKLLVKEGEVVKKGQPLVELEPTALLPEAETEKYKFNLAAARAEASRLAQLAKLAGSQGANAAPAYPTGSGAEAMLLRSQWEEFQSRNRAVQAELARRQAELNSAHELRQKLTQTLPLASKRAADYQDLANKNYVSNHAWMEKEQVRLETERDLAYQTSRLVELASAVQEVQAKLTNNRDEFIRTNLTGAQESLRRAQQLEQELRSVQARQRNQVLLSPHDGLIQGVAVTGASAVVSAGSTLMLVVPGDYEPEVEAWLENKDVAYVKPGQMVALKLDAYPFVHYGLVPASVKTVSADATVDEKRGLLYKVTIVPDSAEKFGSQSKTAIKLTPGMAVSAEILTRKRRALDYFLDPIRKTGHEGLRER